MGVSRVDRRDRFNFTVETLYNGRSVEIVAGAQSVTVAHAAFDAVVGQCPERNYILSQNGRVFRKWPENLEIR